MEKRCPKCDTIKPISNFYRNLKRHDGLAGWCVPCELAAGKASVAKLRAQTIKHLGGKCAACGYDTVGPALQIDHVNGDGAQKRKTNGAPRAVLQAALLDEDGRYQLLCANCNQIKRIE